MTLPKKKHLIELMIEAGVKWPVGAEYAAQDEHTRKVNFYRNGKPDFQSKHGERMADDCTFMSDYEFTLPSLCRNWLKTIVTCKQYAEALASTPMTPAAQQETQLNQVRESEDAPASQLAAHLYSGVAGVMPSESIEALLAEIKAKREDHAALVASAEVLALHIVDIELQVNDKLKQYGFAMSPVEATAKPAEQELVITDWRDLRVGDVIFIGESSVPFTAPSGEYKVVGVDVERETQPAAVEWCDGEVWPLLAERGWRFIRRP